MNVNFQRQQANLKDKSDLELLNEFFDFLQGECPDRISVGEMPALSKKQAFAVIYYLQEHLPVFPDTIEMCDNCEDLFDLNVSGIHCELCGHLCGRCEGECDCYNEQD